MTRAMTLLAALALVSCAESAPPRTKAPPQQPPAAYAYPTATATATGPAPAPTASATPAPPVTAANTSAPKTDPPRQRFGSAQVGTPSVSGTVSHADYVVKELRAAFARCYDNGLEADPTAEGTLLVALQLVKDGSVSRADATIAGKVPAPIVACIKEKAKAAQFTSPNEGSAIVSFSVTLTRTQPSGDGADTVTVSPEGYAEQDRVAQFVRANARECYKKQLDTKPQAEGRVSVRLTIDADGKVTSAEAISAGNLPDGLAACVEKRSKPAFFKKPANGVTTVTVPVSLALKPKK